MKKLTDYVNDDGEPVNSITAVRIFGNAHFWFKDSAGAIQGLDGSRRFWAAIMPAEGD